MANLRGGSTIGGQLIESSANAQAKVDAHAALSGVGGHIPSGGTTTTYLRGDGTWATLSATLAGMTDVTITTPTSGQFLTYDGTKWVNSALPTSSTSGAGIVQLSSSTSSTSTTLAATASAVKAAYDLAAGKQANLGYTPVNDAGDDMNGKLNINTTNGRLVIPVGTDKYAT